MSRGWFVFAVGGGLVLALSGCRLITSISATDAANCDKVYSLTLQLTEQNIQAWNESFKALESGDDSGLRKVGKDFTDTDLRSLEAAAPYRNRALEICDGLGWHPDPNAPSPGSGPTPSESGLPASYGGKL